MSNKERLEYLEETKFDLECEIHRLDLEIKELKKELKMEVKDEELKED